MKELIYSFYMLVGTYTGSGPGQSEGIYVYGFDPETARTEYVAMAKVENPSYMTVSEDGRMVYAVSENGPANSRANALRFDPRTGGLTLVDSEIASGGAPCNIVSNGRIVLTANYLGGDISVFGIEESGGQAGTLTPVRQILTLPGSDRASRMHCVKFSPDGSYLFVSDLGTDKILRYNVTDGGTRIDEGSLVTFDLPEGSGPRHFIFDDKGQSIYLINEYSGRVVGFDYNGGDLRLRQSIASDTVGGRSSADIVLSPDGRYLYASNRAKNDGIAMFSVSGEGESKNGNGNGNGNDGRSGEGRGGNGSEDKVLKPVGYKNTGRFPRNLSIAPGGKFLLSAEHGPGTIEVFEIDYASGVLLPKPEATVRLGKPVCVVFIPAIQ